MVAGSCGPLGLAYPSSLSGDALFGLDSRCATSQLFPYGCALLVGTLRSWAQRIELWPIERLVPYERNARTHSDHQIRQIANSIAEFGFTNPILVDTQAGIIAGHARLLAARQLKLPQVPVIVLSHLSDAQKRAYILADNRLALDAGWDDELLRQELQALENEGFDLDLAGFDADELKDFLGEESALAEEDDVPQTETVAVCRPGDIWILGSHRILCGDALQPSHLEQVLGGSPADMVFTDPPYNVDRQVKKHRPIANDDLGEGFEPFLYQACLNLLRFTRGGIYICMSSSQLQPYTPGLPEPADTGPRL